MSEEEIIHYIELCIENKGIPSEGINWVKCLLDLYNKQKEELETEKHYSKVYEDMVKDYEKICIEKNKKIEELKQLLEG